MLWKGANSSGKCSSTEVSYSALHCRGAHYVDASAVLLTVAKHHSAQSITDEGRFKFSFRALTRIIKRVKLLGISSSLLAICTTACSLLQSKCLFTGCYFLSGVFGEKKLKQTSHYRLLCFGEVSGKSVLCTGFIILWSGFALLEKCLGKAHIRVMNYRMENCCEVC